MTAPHKFLFDRSFDQPDPPRAAARKAPPPPPPEPTFSRVELDAAREAGFTAGHEAALTTAAHATEERIAATLSIISGALAALIEARESDAEDVQRRCGETMRAIIQKTVPALCRKAPLTEVETLVAECLREAFDEPRVVLRVADGLFDAMQQRLGALTGAAGFAGKVVLLADETLGPGDARVEWAEGGAERDTRQLMHEFDGALARALDAIPVSGTSPREESKHE
jgi:flagellar assembly protein FliH